MNILIFSVAVFLVARILPGIWMKSYFTAIWVALVYSVVNFFFGWLLLLLTLPLVVFTLGLFKLVINGMLLWLTDKLIDDFEIRDFPTTLLAALLITLVDTGLRWIF